MRYPKFTRLLPIACSVVMLFGSSSSQAEETSEPATGEETPSDAPAEEPVRAPIGSSPTNESLDEGGFEATTDTDAASDVVDSDEGMPEPIMPAAEMTPVESVSEDTGVIYSDDSYSAPVVRTPMSKLLQYQVRERDPHLAFWLSTIVGFGAGHFYSGNTTFGALTAAIQVAGGVIGGIGAAWIADYHSQRTSVLFNDRTAYTIFTVAEVTGAVILVIGRVLDMVTAPGSADDANQVTLEELE